MIECYSSVTKGAVTIFPISAHDLPAHIKELSVFEQQWLQATDFQAKSGQICLLPNKEGLLQTVLFGVNEIDTFWIFGDLPNRLPPGVFRFAEEKFSSSSDFEHALMAWALGCYRFKKYRQQEIPQTKIVIPQSINLTALEQLINTYYFVRDLINIPTADLGPQDLAEEAVLLGQKIKANVKVIQGQQLLQQNFPAIYAVGRASHQSSHFVSIEWGNPQHPTLAILGKGVCFDTGGLDLKSSEAMRLMKKDMSGAAYALGLAQLIVAEQLPVHLRVFIPAVENSVSSTSYRPGDVLKTRAGLTVEVTNTDAEGRLVLCDALAEACRHQPDRIIDFSTLTGAARTALGPDIPAMFCNDETMAQELLAASQRAKDPLWRLPLYQPYESYLKSEVADLANAASLPYAGAITAALFLKRFVAPNIPWAHFDLMAWNVTASPGRPIGGEMMGVRAVFEYLKKTYVK